MMKLIVGEMESLKKGTWSPEEDEKLSAYIKRYGIWNWSLMPKAAGLSRSGKSCRLRWMNYLKPSIKREGYSSEEIETITMLHKSLGNKWSKIAENLPGRTDNGIKKFWHTHLKRRCSSIPIGPSDGENNHGNEAKRAKHYKCKKATQNHSSRAELNSPTRESTLQKTNELNPSASESTLSSLEESFTCSERNDMENGSSESRRNLDFQWNLLIEQFLVEDGNALDMTSSSFDFVEHVDIQEHACDSFSDDLDSWLNNVFVDAQEVEYDLW